MAGSLDDNPPQLYVGTEHTFGPDDYQYLVLSRDKAPNWASIYVSSKATMTNSDIAAQLRRLANFVEGAESRLP